MYRWLSGAIMISVGIVLLLPLLAQDKKQPSNAVEQAIEAKNYKQADSLLGIILPAFVTARNWDTIIYFLPLNGETGNALYGADHAVANSFSLIHHLKAGDAKPTILVKAYRAAAEFFANIGQSQHGYYASDTALLYTLQHAEHTQSDIAQCRYNLGVYAQRLGNISLSLSHHRVAMDIRLADKTTDPEDLYRSGNAMGALMWYASKFDSATIYYTMALDALERMPASDMNKYYRTGNIQNNLAGLYSNEGKTSMAIASMEKAIFCFQQFIASKNAGDKKQSATEGLYEAIDNLAGIYKEIGDYNKAGRMLRYAYQGKQQALDPAHSGIFISQVLLGQYFYAVHKYDSATIMLNKALKNMGAADGDYLLWQADAYYTQALIYENFKQYDKAAAAYDKAESCNEKAYQGQYDHAYMDFLRNAALFYAEQGNYAMAMSKANKVYKYLVEVGESHSLMGFYQLLNIATISQLTGRNKDALSYCEKAMEIVQANLANGSSLLDSIKMQVFIPKAILIEAKARYALQSKKDTAFLIQVSARLKEALQTFEKRKTIIHDESSINILMADNQELFDFAKKIALELALLSGKEAHLDNLINLHESALYNRIRKRLNKQRAISFSGIPDSVYKEENILKQSLAASLQDVTKPRSELMNDYLKASDNWEDYLEDLRHQYPQYYDMRYADIYKPAHEVQATLPNSTTVVRYFFVDTTLMALVMDSQIKHLVTIHSQDLATKLDNVLGYTASESTQLKSLNELYRMLWAPLKPYVANRRVIIIPDGILYNLSFEMLTPELLGSYLQLAKGSLLTKHIFSYHYSLLMMGQNTMATGKRPNYVAFAPGFSDDLKAQYLTGNSDPVKLDYDYLKLLPQPAIYKLANQAKELLGGKVFASQASTKASFIANAGSYKIVHVATHAAYDNVHPENSGLIFAKNPLPPSDSNFLSQSDIYQYNIPSELLILTACESGRPGYQDGEGMVSLAHAFNYAGSNRILTALWEIDEQSSSQITGHFLKNLKDGMLTDVALQQAKLVYLDESRGRVLAPAYWAGLIMLGEPDIIRLEKSSWLIPPLGIAFLIAFFLAIFLWLLRKRRKID
jgi:tetratricopeptide (TPR) repeat protein